MKCFYHEDRDAVATCQKCGKSLCKECASKHKPCLCDDCWEEEQENRKNEYNSSVNDLRKSFIVKVVIGLIVACMFGSLGVSAESSSMMIILGILGFGLPFGWVKVKAIVGKVLSGWILAAPLYLGICAIGGWMIGPICFILAVKDLITYSKE